MVDAQMTLTASLCTAKKKDRVEGREFCFQIRTLIKIAKRIMSAKAYCPILSQKHAKI